MKLLEVNLSSETFRWKDIRNEELAKYLGGRGLGVRYLYDNLAPGVDPLGPENILSLWTSPVMGVGAISVVKTCGVTKSPLTGTILMSLMGGRFGPAMRFAGVDGIVIKGVSKKPVYLHVENGNMELRPADHLWGKTTRETEHILKQELEGEKFQIASIGQAGENLIPFASIMHGGDAMGRGGIGAVMGSKLLKAVVVSGQGQPELADRERFKQTVKRIADIYRKSEPIKLFGAVGTTQHVDGLNKRMMYPTKNYQTNKFDQYQSVNASTLYKNFVEKRATCYACTVRCRRESSVHSEQYGDIHTEGPEYETLWSFGGNLGNSSLESIIVANDLCLEYGLDTISTGMVISFAMECYENGLIDKDMTDGLDLSFGNSEAVIALVHKIARKEGIGELLAKGTRAAAAEIGKGAEAYAMQVKGLELAGYDPRVSSGMGLGYATSPRGGCHERGYPLEEVLGLPVVDRFSNEGKGAYIKEKQDGVAVKDALGFCVLSSAGTSFQDLAELFSAATGIAMTETELLKAGERICNLERLFNLREGFTREDDTLPERLLKEAVKGTDGEMHVVDLEVLLNDYYTARGWDQSGIPLKSTLERLDLAE